MGDILSRAWIEGIRKQWRRVLSHPTMQAQRDEGVSLAQAVPDLCDSHEMLRGLVRRADRLLRPAIRDPRLWADAPIGTETISAHGWVEESNAFFKDARAALDED